MREGAIAKRTVCGRQVVVREVDRREATVRESDEEALTVREDGRRGEVRLEKEMMCRGKARWWWWGVVDMI